MATLDEIWTKLQEGKEYTKEAFLSDTQGVVNTAVKAKAEVFESVLKEHGFDKPDGAAGHSFLSETIGKIKGERERFGKQVAELTGQVEKITANAPKADEIKAKFEQQIKDKEAEIETLNGKIKTTERNGLLSGITSQFKYDETVADRAKMVEKLVFSELNTNFDIKEVDGVQALYKNDVLHRDNNGQLVTVDSYLKSELSPFFKKEEQQNPPQGPPSAQTGFKTNKEALAYATEHKIDVLSAEGQALLLQQMPVSE